MQRHLRAVGIGCAVVAAMTACSGGGGAPTTAGRTAASGATIDTSPRPGGVPAGAVIVTGDLSFGEPAADGDPATRQLFYSQSCRDGVLVLVTDRLVIYAELPCDRALPPDRVEPFLGQPVRVRAVLGPPAKLYVESSLAGSIEFTVGRLWLTSS